MESFLQNDISASSSRNEPRSNRHARAAVPTMREPSAVTVIDAEVVPAAARPAAAEQVRPASPTVMPAVAAPITVAPAPEPVPIEVPPKPNEFSAIEQMLRAIQEMVEGNREAIQGLKSELDARKNRQEDTTRVEALLAEEERKSQALLDKLAETEGRLATSEAEKRNLANTVQAQDALLEKQNALKFTDEELAQLLKYSAVIIFDTCSIMNYPNLLDGVNDGELVVVPKDVNNELEHHKSRFGADDRKIKAQRAITAIFNYKRRFPLHTQRVYLT